MARSASPRPLYRIVRANPPTITDFLSDDARGRGTPSDPPEIRRLRTGRSVFATEAQARRRARTFPMLGQYIARLEIPEDSPVQVERTLGAGHHTIWGEPDLLLAYVAAVVPV